MSYGYPPTVVAILKVADGHRVTATRFHLNRPYRVQYKLECGCGWSTVAVTPDQGRGLAHGHTR